MAVCKLPGGKSPALTPDFCAGVSFRRTLAAPGHAKGLVYQYKRWHSSVIPGASPCTIKVADIDIVTVGLGIRAEAGSILLG